MVRISLEEVRKHSEHHDGPLQELEEIALHQLKIRKIEFLNDECKGLKILLLQNNKISRIENLYRLKSLCYLNLAINRITRIQNLERCESLRKLDLTANLIYDYRDVTNLSSLPFFTELYLTGNECCAAKNYKCFVISQLPVLCKLDGQEISKTDRILAHQEYSELAEEIGRENYTEEIPEYILQSEGSDYEENDANTRLKKAAEETAIDACEIRERPKHEKGQLNDEGVVCEWNELGFPVAVDEDWRKQELIVKIGLPVYMNSDLVELDVNETWFYLKVKEKSIEMRLDRKIRFGLVEAHRITTTGVLKLHCPVCEDNPIEAPVQERIGDNESEEEKPMHFTYEHKKFSIEEKVDDVEDIEDVPSDLPDLL